MGDFIFDGIDDMPISLIITCLKIGWGTPEFTLMETRTSVPVSELAISSSQ